MTLRADLEERRSARPVEIDLSRLALASAMNRFPAVYRLWTTDSRCLYVGQTTVHPIVRMQYHRRHKPWWQEVTRADYVFCPRRLLDPLEQQFIWDLKAVHNYPTHGWNWIGLGPRPAAYLRNPLRRQLTRYGTVLA